MIVLKIIVIIMITVCVADYLITKWKYKQSVGYALKQMQEKDKEHKRNIQQKLKTPTT